MFPLTRIILLLVKIKYNYTFKYRFEHGFVHFFKTFKSFLLVEQVLQTIFFLSYIFYFLRIPWEVSLYSKWGIYMFWSLRDFSDNKAQTHYKKYSLWVQHVICKNWTWVRRITTFILTTWYIYIYIYVLAFFDKASPIFDESNLT